MNYDATNSLRWSIPTRGGNGSQSSMHFIIQQKRFDTMKLDSFAVGILLDFQITRNALVQFGASEIVVVTVATSNRIEKSRRKSTAEIQNSSILTKYIWKSSLIFRTNRILPWWGLVPYLYKPSSFLLNLQFSFLYDTLYAGARILRNKNSGISWSRWWVQAKHDMAFVSYMTEMEPTSFFFSFSRIWYQINFFLFFIVA